MAQISGDGDVQRLNAALDSEHAAVAAYTTARHSHRRARTRTFCKPPSGSSAPL
jgi:hypothetical protein